MLQKNFLLIAYKYIFFKNKENNLSFISKLTFFIIFISTLSLTLIISITKGFSQQTKMRIQSIYPDIIVELKNYAKDKKLFLNLAKTSFKNIITNYSFQASNTVFIINKANYDEPIYLCLKGIDLNAELNTTNLKSKLLISKAENKNLHLKNNEIIIGKKLFDDLNLKLNQDIELIEIKLNNFKQIKTKKITVNIKNCFQTGIEDFDKTLIFCNKKFFKQEFSNIEPNQLYIKIKSKKMLKQTITALKTQLNLSVYSWKQLYSSIISALKIEKYSIYLILFLILLIASLNIISLILIFVKNKETDIALLITLGISKKKIKIIFCAISLFITFIATLLGILAAFFIGILIKKAKFIKIANSSYIAENIPIILDYKIFLLVLLTTLLASFLISLFPLRYIFKINIAEIFKNN